MSVKLFFLLFIIIIVTIQLQVLIMWYKTLYNDEMEEDDDFISFYFRKGFSRILPGSSWLPCFILHPKDNTPETLRLVKKINFIAILIYMMNIVLFSVIILMTLLNDNN